MLTDERSTPTTLAPIPRRRSGWLVAAASFTAILLAAGGLWFATRGSDTGDVAGQPPTTNAPTTEAERIALDAIVAYYTFNEADLRALASTPNTELIDIGVSSMQFDRALNASTESVSCTMAPQANSSVTCELTTNDDLLAVFGIEDHPIEAKVTVLDGGWADVRFERNFGASPSLTSFFAESTSGLFDEGGLCFWTPDTAVSAVDWDACAAAFIAFAENWVAENG